MVEIVKELTEDEIAILEESGAKRGEREMKDDPQGCKYEQMVQRVCQEMMNANDVRLHTHREYKGRNTGRSIQIDISFEMQVLGTQVLVLAECKHLKRKVEAGDVVKFYGDLQDIGAHKGVIFTTAGYQEGAIKVAKSHGIALVVLDPVKRPTDMKYVTKAFCPSGVSFSDCFLQGRIRTCGGRLGCESIGELRFDNVDELLDLLRLSMFGVAAPEIGNKKKADV